MKSRCFWLKVSALAILALASIPMVQAQNAAPKRKVRIAVLDFDYATVTTSSAAVFGTSVDGPHSVTFAPSFVSAQMLERATRL